MKSRMHSISLAISGAVIVLVALSLIMHHIDPAFGRPPRPVPHSNGVVSAPKVKVDRVQDIGNGEVEIEATGYAGHALFTQTLVWSVTAWAWNDGSSKLVGTWRDETRPIRLAKGRLDQRVVYKDRLMLPPGRYYLGIGFDEPGRDVNGNPAYHRMASTLERVTIH